MKLLKLGAVLSILGILLGPLACGKNLPPTSTQTSAPPSYSDWNITSAVTLNAGSYNYNNVHIFSTGILQLAGPNASVTNAAVTLNLTGSFVMDAGASVVGIGTGYGPGFGPGAGSVSFANAGGGGHGGAGGVGGVAAAGPANDDSLNPVLMGSGGGSPTGAGAGGALFRVNAVDATLNGSVLCDGNSGVAGGAAGGTIDIQANTIFGNGILESYGGTSALPNTGGGGGGIILLSIHSGYYFTGTTNVSGGTGHGTNSTGANGYFTQAGY